jgi:hypothetical protein
MESRQTKEVQREQIEGSLRDINQQLAIMAVKYEENKQEVRAREVEIKTARRELLTDVEKAIKESGNQFKDGRDKMVKSLAEYETACNKMEQGLIVMKDIADELIRGQLPAQPKLHPAGTNVTINVAPKYQIGTNLVPHYHGPINAKVSPGGKHFTSPMGTVRSIGTSKITIG